MFVIIARSPSSIQVYVKNMKTAVTVLQEMMVKLGLTPEYECISQSGPKHQALFEYRCNALGVVVTASARSKKEAKQEVARIMLQQLSARGHPVPPPYSVPIAMQEDSPFSAGGPGDTRSYVALLRELCEEYRLTGVTYELVGDTGPPHLRHFTVRARIGQHERFATATTKKMARQMAAEKLYTYLRENLARVTRDFNEEDALVRAHEKAMERYHENEEAPRRPDLGLRVADYHIGLAALLGRPSYTEAYRDSTMSIDEDTRSLARSALEQGRSQSPTRALQAVAETLGLELQASCLEREGEAPLCVLQVTGCSPELAFAEPTAAAAAGAAMDYVRRALTELCQ